MIDKYTNNYPDKAMAFNSMGQVKYLSAMKHASVVVGNSSSGIIEAPSLRVPTVNIGDRQRGRLRAKSVIDCSPTKGAIIKALEQAVSSGFRQSIKRIKNPYEKKNAGHIIKETIKHFCLDGILKKVFYDFKR